MIGQAGVLRQLRRAGSASGCGNSAERGSEAMRWSKPKIVEIAVGTEINSYACAAIA
jgi:coenzyme PQQ precursor peptide PqqA